MCSLYPLFSRLQPNGGCVRSFANGTNGMPMQSEVTSLAAIGTNDMPIFTNDKNHWQPILQTTWSVGKITKIAPNDVIFKMTTNKNDEHIGAEMKEITTIFSVSMGENTRFSKFQ